MSKKIVFKGTPDGCFLPFEPDLLQLDLQEPNSKEPPSDSRMKQIEELAKLSIKETRNFCFDSFTEDDWAELCLRNSSFLYHPESYCLNNEVRQAIILMTHFNNKKIRIGFNCAKHLLKILTCEIVSYDIETALPIKIGVSKKDIEDILVPFQQEQKTVFSFLLSGNTEGIFPEIMQKLAAELAISNLTELQNFLAIYRPGPLTHFNDYKNNSPCKLLLAQDIAEETRGVLLYHNQCELALQRMTGCTPEEAEFFRQDNSGLLTGKSYELLLQRIANHQNVSLYDARWNYFNPWGCYAFYSAPRKYFQKRAYRDYLRTLKNYAYYLKCSFFDYRLSSFDHLYSAAVSDLC